MKPYYQDDLITLYHADCFQEILGIEDNSVDLVLTDPPYTERTHKQAKTNKGKGHGSKAVNFGHIEDGELLNILSAAGRKTRGWVISTLDYRHAVGFESEPPEGLRALRVGVWVKTNPMPQISADRPAQGWEAIAYLHRDDTKPSWGGGGRAGNYVLPVEQRTGHPTAKPLSMIEDLISKFTKPGGLVLDPFAGSGTTLRAAKNLGRKAIGFEIEEEYCEIIAKRLAQEVLFV